MQKQKRDPKSRAYQRGYRAAILGHSTQICPFSTDDRRSYWLTGWRDGHDNAKLGRISSSAAYLSLGEKVQTD